MRWTPHRTTRRAPAVDVVEPPLPTPVPAPAPDLPPDVPVGCRVVLVGLVGVLRALPADLPSSWSVSTVDEIGDITVADLVVLTQPTIGKIASVLARQPDASVVALTPRPRRSTW